PLPFQLLQLALCAAFEAREFEFRKLGYGEERSHEADVDRTDKEVLGRPRPLISLKLGRGRDQQVGESFRTQMAPAPLGPFNFGVVKVGRAHCEPPFSSGWPPGSSTRAETRRCSYCALTLGSPGAGGETA